ncbi:MerR family transcriptional regulator [Schaalia vaccimaxillae]|uniref:transcriptional regulator FtsR n=1 Tax=Schaalia vaccimaxillae TaxID=183916 RepID=UPI00041DA6C6|nr:MerR family transcriptional regulator [Schaalia vaccimaxillae]
MSQARALKEEQIEELGPWPRGVSRDPVLSIGQVVGRLEAEFPAITVSKIRFLEDQGLVTPARTAAGYRKYSKADIERLRYVLIQQRDSFTPLKVIGDQLLALDAGHEVEPVRPAQVVASQGRVVATANRKSIPVRDLCDLTGLDVASVDRLTRLGIITPDIGGYFPSRCVQVVQLVIQLESMGFDARLLRTVRNSAERAVDVIDQTVSSQRSRRRAGDLERANARAVDFGEIIAELHKEMLRVSILQLTEHND